MSINCMCRVCLYERVCNCASRTTEYTDHDHDCDYRALIELGVCLTGQAVMDAAMEVGVCEPNLGTTVDTLTARFRQ